MALKVDEEEKRKRLQRFDKGKLDKDLLKENNIIFETELEQS